MQNRQSGRRRRGGGGGTGGGGGGNGGHNPRPMGLAAGSPNANRLEVRVRGNAHQLLEKYKVLARDAHQAGDRVAAEYYLQHSDHYFRVLNDSRIRHDEMRARRGAFDQYEDDGIGDGEDQAGDGTEEAGEAEPPPRGERQERRPRYEQQDEAPGDDDRQRRRPERPREDVRPRDPVRPRDDVRAGPRDGARDSGRDAPRLNGDAAEVRLSDGEAALIAFGGLPARERAGADAAPEAAADMDGEAPRPRRRGRPRKTETETLDS